MERQDHDGQDQEAGGAGHEARELVGGVASDVARLDKKYKEGLADLAKRALTARQGKQFIVSEVAVLREYIGRGGGRRSRSSSRREFL